MQRSLLTLLALGAGALSLAACGADGTTTAGGPAGGATHDDAPDQVVTTADGAVQVSMKANAYHPRTITVRPGQRITWVNDDDVLHDVVSTSGESIESELFPRGQTFSYTPTRRGTIRYVCTIHPGMEGTIEVR